MVGFLEWAEDRPLFNLNQAARFTGLSKDSLKVKLSRKVKSGEIYRIERGKYTAHSDSLIYASHVEVPSYVSLWSAMDFYNLTTQQPSMVQVICSRNREDLQGIEFYSSGKMFGYIRKRYRGFEVFVAEKERLLLDVLNLGKVPVEELEELVNKVDLEKTVEYVQRFDSNTLSKRTGYLIQKVRGETLEELRIEDSNYPVLDLTKTEIGETNSEWRLKVNNDVI